WQPTDGNDRELEEACGTGKDQWRSEHTGRGERGGSIICSGSLSIAEAIHQPACRPVSSAAGATRFSQCAGQVSCGDQQLGRATDAPKNSRSDSTRWSHERHESRTRECDLPVRTMGGGVLRQSDEARAFPGERERVRCCSDDDSEGDVWLCEGERIHGNPTALCGWRAFLSHPVARGA